MSAKLVPAGAELVCAETGIKTNSTKLTAIENIIFFTAHRSLLKVQIES
jgi:hypothetical protein